MTDENKCETEVKSKDVQEKILKKFLKKKTTEIEQLKKDLEKSEK